jgi:hypothetical protein
VTLPGLRTNGVRRVSNQKDPAAMPSRERPDLIDVQLQHARRMRDQRRDRLVVGPETAQQRCFEGVDVDVV